jgi:hypothetical protein
MVDDLVNMVERRRGGERRPVSSVPPKRETIEARRGKGGLAHEGHGADRKVRPATAAPVRKSKNESIIPMGDGFDDF